MSRLSYWLMAYVNLRRACAALIVAIVMVLINVDIAWAGDISGAIKLYNAKDYPGALKGFESELKVTPSNAVALYYLANTYLATSQLVKAKYNYQLCAHYATDAATQNLCKTAIAQIDAHKPKTQARMSGTRSAQESVTKDPTSDKAPGATPDVDDKVAVDNSPKAKLEKAKAEIMDKARAECSKIRKEVEDRIEREAATSQIHVGWPDGSFGINLPDVIRDQYKAEAEVKCAHIMNEAEARCKGFR